MTYCDVAVQHVQRGEPQADGERGEHGEQHEHRQQHDLPVGATP